MTFSKEEIEKMEEDVDGDMSDFEESDEENLQTRNSEDDSTPEVYGCKLKNQIQN